jgi:predicted membrane metal-binding protein
VHLTLGILRKSQAFFYALAFFWLDGFAVPAPAQVTQTVRQVLALNLLRNFQNWFVFQIGV